MVHHIPEFISNYKNFETFCSSLKYNKKQNHILLSNIKNKIKNLRNNFCSNPSQAFEELGGGGGGGA